MKIRINTLHMDHLYILPSNKVNRHFAKLTFPYFAACNLQSSDHNTNCIKGRKKKWMKISILCLALTCYLFLFHELVYIKSVEFESINVWNKTKKDLTRLISVVLNKIKLHTLSVPIILYYVVWLGTKFIIYNLQCFKIILELNKFLTRRVYLVGFLSNTWNSIRIKSK